MKKKKILLLVLFGLFTLLFNSRVVLAANEREKVIGYMSCFYKIEKNEDLILLPYVDGGIIKFAYSEIGFSNFKLKNELYIKYNPNQGNNEGYTTFEFASKSSQSNVKYGSIAESFISRVNGYGNDGTCPKYVFFRKVSGDYLPYFRNSDSGMKDKCGDDYSACSVVAKLTSGGSSQIFYHNDYEWSFGNIDKTGANITLYVSDQKNLKFKMKTNATGDDSIKKISKVAIYNSGNFHVWNGFPEISRLYSLFKDNKARFGFKTAFEEESLIFDGNGGLEEDYHTDGLINSTRITKCTTYNETKNDLSKHLEELFRLSYRLEQTLKDHSCYNGSEAPSELKDYVGCDFVNGFTPAKFEEMVKNLGDEEAGFIASYQNDYKQVHDSYQTYLEEISSKICYSDEEQLKNSKQLLIEAEEKVRVCPEGSDESCKNGSYYDRLLNLSERIAKAAQTRKDISEDTKNIAGTLVEQTKDLGEVMNYYYEVVKSDSLISEDEDFNLNVNLEGCGIMTPGLEGWLTQLLDIIKISALVLTLILGMVDFFRGVASGSADTMKKVWTNFSRRLLVVVILFLLPVLLEFILGMLNIPGLEAGNPLCGLK